MPLKENLKKNDTPVVNVKGLKKYFTARKTSFFGKPATIKAVDDISFSINLGETLGIVGESGSGKTTAIRSMLRLIEPTSGSIVLNGKPIHSLSKSQLREFRQSVQIVVQDPYSSLNPRMPVGKIITEPLMIHGTNTAAERKAKQDELLNIVGLSPDQADRYPHEFSGGQRQRISIARALSSNPSVIVLDEPVSALDVSIQGQILNLLKEIQNKRNLTYIFIAHDLAVVEYMSDFIAVMYLGKIVEEGPRLDLYKKPLHPYTQSLMSSIPTISAKKHAFSVISGEIPSPEHPPAGCHFNPRCPHVMDICKSEYPPVYEVENSSVRCFLHKC